MNFEILFRELLPILTLFLGFMLNEISQALRLGREDRRTVGRALSGLLELRHEMISLSAFRRLMEQFGVDASGIRQAQAYLRQKFLSGLTDWRNHYEAAAAEIAAADPLLSFKLRNKSRIFDVMETLMGDANAADVPSEVWTAFEARIHKDALPAVEALIRQLAWRHSARMWFRVRSKMKLSDADLVKEIKNFTISIGLNIPEPLR